MSHRLKPQDLTNILLSTSSNKFCWTPAQDRLVRFDKFVDNIEAQFQVVAWGDEPLSASKGKIDLFNLVAGKNIRDVISEILTETPDILFRDLVTAVRCKLLKGLPPLLSLSKILAVQQNFDEPFEEFYGRVIEATTLVNWDDITTENIKNMIVAITLACKSRNPFVMGHCLSIKNFEDIKLEDIVNTAVEYEKKNPTKQNLFPNFGVTNVDSAPACSSGGLFGNQSGGSSNRAGQQNLFANTSTTTFGGFANNNSTGSFGGASFGAAASSSDGPSSEEQRINQSEVFKFGASKDNNTVPFKFTNSKTNVKRECFGEAGGPKEKQLKLDPFSGPKN